MLTRGALAGLVVVLAGLVAAPAYAADRVFWIGGGAVSVSDLGGAGSPTTLYAGQGTSWGLDLDGTKLIWSDNTAQAIRSAPLDGSGPVADLTSTARPPRGLAVDASGGRALFLDDRGLRAVPLGGGAPSTVYDCCAAGSGGPEDGLVVAVDDVGGRAYFDSGVGGDGLFSAPLDGRGPVELVSRWVSDDDIGGVAVDPVRGFAYWTNVNSGGGFAPGTFEIRRAPLDGSGPVDVLYDHEPAGGIAVDGAEGYLYWAGVNRIRRAPLDGSGPVETVLETPHARAIVLLRTPLSTEAPEITGGSTTGSQLRCSTGTWTNENIHGSFVYRPPATIFTYRWQRDGTDVPGATHATYTPSEPGEYRCVVTAGSSAGTTGAASAARVVEAAPPGAGPVPAPVKSLALGRAFLGRSGSIFVPITCANPSVGYCDTTLRIVFKKPRHGFKTVTRRLRLAEGSSVTRVALSRKQRRKVVRMRRLVVRVSLTNPAVRRTSTLWGRGALTR